MSYTYDQRKRPPLRQESATEPSTAPGPGMDALMRGQAFPGAARKERGFDLDAAMKAKMEHAFGNLSAVKDYSSPAQTRAPAPAGPYTGPVTHTLSAASPSSASAGPMQAKRSRSGGGKKKAGAAKSAPKAVRPSYYDMVDARQYNEDTKLLSKYDSGSGEPEEDGDADIVTSEMLRELQSRNNKKVDKLFHIAAGQLVDNFDAENTKDKIISTKYNTFLKEEKAKGTKHEYADIEARDRAYAYYNANIPKLKKTVKKEDSDWYKRTMRHPSVEMIRLVQKKRLQAAKNLVDYRENLGKTNSKLEKDKLDFETAFSQQALDFNLYDRLMTDMSMSPEYVEFMREYNRNLCADNKDNLERMKITDPATKLALANLEENSYNSSEEGKRRLPALMAKQRKAYYNIYKNRTKSKKKKK